MTAMGLLKGQRDASNPKRLYDFPFSGNGYKVRLALAYLGFTIEYKIVDLLAGEAGSPAFLAKNPMGQVPVLELEDGTFLRESNAILFWLAEGTPLMPTERLTRARVVQWMCFEQSNIDKVLGRTCFLKRYPDFMATTSADWDHWYATGYRALEVMEAELRSHAFLVGDHYSAADICLYGYVHCAEEGRFSLERYPAVKRWRSQVQQRGHVPIAEVGPTFPPPRR
jgi:glutathione S-transferase